MCPVQFPRTLELGMLCRGRPKGKNQHANLWNNPHMANQSASTFEMKQTFKAHSKQTARTDTTTDNNTRQYSRTRRRASPYLPLRPHGYGNAAGPSLLASCWAAVPSQEVRPRTSPHIHKCKHTDTRIYKKPKISSKNRGKD